MPTTPTLSSSSAVPLPSGCSPSDFRGPNFSGTANGAFSGCVVGIASVLQIVALASGARPPS
ncbi:hypothetical protein B0H13DRAFT_2347026 [Mycena leptocephala]|nr:hypothetical protein B0H13DRAFT_2347026 [Mycena leptocephala]